MWLTLSILVVLFVLTPHSSQLAAADEISGELVGLNVSLAAEKQLVVHDQLVAAEEWTSAIDLLDRLSADQSDVLVKVGPERYVGLPNAIQQRLAKLPPAGREAYQKRASSNAAALLARARAEGDPKFLWRLVEDSAATPAAQSAIESLAAQAATRGDLELALRLWGRLLPPNPADVRVFPPPMISLPLTDNRQLSAIDRKALVTRQLVGVPLTPAELKTLGGDLPATDTSPQTIDDPAEGHSPTSLAPNLGSVRWSTAATANCPLLEFQAPLSLESGRSGLLLLNNGQSVRAVRMESGEPFWSTGIPDDVGVLWEDTDSLVESSTELTCRIAGGVCSQDRYFGVLGDAPRWRSRPGLIPLAGSLIALDLNTGQGRLEWQVESRNLPESDWLFHGAPAFSRGHLPGDDLVIVPLCRPDSQVELAVAAYFADDGRLAWWTRVGTSAAEAGYPLPNTQLLTQAGLVVARTLTGVVVALDTRHGQIQWASTAMVDSPPSIRSSHAPLLDARAGFVVVGSSTQSRAEIPQVVGFSLDSGTELWRQELPFPVQGVVCASPGKVLAAGSRLRALSLRDGMPLWEHGNDDPTTAGTGAPAVYNSTVVWPTRTGLWGVDLSTGSIAFERRITIEPVAQPMELVPAGSYWMISRPDAVLCLPDSNVVNP